jgi:hypothetical protein
MIEYDCKDEEDTADALYFPYDASAVGKSIGGGASNS